MNFLKVKKTKIVDRALSPVHLRGLNLGGWLMMEAYFMHAPNRAEQLFKKKFTAELGPTALKEFEKHFRASFIQEKDFAQIAKWGFNSLRVPFNFRLVESAPYKYSQAGLAYLDQVVKWAKKYKIWIILDLHAAPGAQNHDWHSDSLGPAELWTKESNRKRVYALWEFLADHFKDEEIIAGYDLLNESVTNDVKTLNKFYHELIKHIRKVDRNHILFIEGNRWSQDVEVLEEFKDDNVVISIHNYEPLQFTFNFIPHLRYPLKGKASPIQWNEKVTRDHLLTYKKFSERRHVPIHVGEFGVNYREGVYGEHIWLKEVLKCFNDYGFHWNYWTYKAVKHFMFPDGVMSYYPNTVWVNRPGPLYGWETYHSHWKDKRREMIESWDSKSFTVNTKVLEELQKAVK